MFTIRENIYDYFLGRHQRFFQNTLPHTSGTYFKKVRQSQTFENYLENNANFCTHLLQLPSTCACVSILISCNLSYDTCSYKVYIIFIALRYLHPNVSTLNSVITGSIHNIKLTTKDKFHNFII